MKELEFGDKEKQRSSLIIRNPFSHEEKQTKVNRLP